MSILVGPLSHVMDLVARHNPRRVISVLDPDMTFPELGPAYADHHLRLSLHDIHDPEPGMTEPAESHMLELVTFLGQCRSDELLLVHCKAGISRSTATAFIAACYMNPGVPERTIATTLRQVAPLARPNEALVRHADTVMQRAGRM